LDTDEFLPRSGVVSAPYRFKASTDLFFPFIFYSSLDGIYLAAYYQASDFLGNHQVQSAVSYADGTENLDYQLTYGYLRYRPKFYAKLSGNEYYDDKLMTIKKKQNKQSISVVYPLNRWQSVGFESSTVERTIYYSGLTLQSLRLRDNPMALFFEHNTVTGAFLEPTSGYRINLRSEFSDSQWGSDYKYNSYAAEINDFVPLGRENLLALRVFGGVSFGRDAGTYVLGGFDRVRGYSSNPATGYTGTKLTFANIEWRFPIAYNVNYYMWYMLPDFYFKTIYGSVFLDSGYTWNDDSELANIKRDDIHGSYGVSLRVHTFLLQTFPVMLNFNLARRLDGPFYTFYLATGTNF